MEQYNLSKITDSDITVKYYNSKQPVSGISFNGPRRIVSPRTSDNLKLIIALFGASISLIGLSIEGIKKLKKK